MNAKPIRLLVVDDSALARKAITSSLAPHKDIEIVGTAVDPYVARDKILELNPDVMTLDIEMPRMDGITFLKRIMKHRPMPVIIISSLTETGSKKALEALQAGAVDVMEKPAGSYSACADGTRLAEKVRAAAGARVRLFPGLPAPDPRPGTAQNRVIASDARSFPARNVILLGASTGGTEALKSVLTSMRGDLPGICIVQHIPAHFSKAFADRLNELCSMEVREAVHNDAVRPGLALVAPGGYHMLLRWQACRYVVELNQGPPIHHQRPAVDVLFDSAIKAGAAPHAAAALLTGMGSDGAAGLLRLRQEGAATIAQNEETCVVFGMPREAILLGAAQHVVPLELIGPRLDQLICGQSAAPARRAAMAGSLQKAGETA
jgi:two-component system chemotaxis response regulator CheB